jgi:molybdopterin biosynthesis enzyme MoaB
MTEKTKLLLKRKRNLWVLMNTKSMLLKKASLAVLSISSTRNIENDESGHWIKKNVINAGHDVLLHQVIPDDYQ